MIPLNKPGNIAAFERDGGFANTIDGYRKQWLFTAGDGLNLIYKQLYAQHGALRVAVSPLACYQAILPIVLNGHSPVLVDVDEQTLNIDPKLIPEDVDVIEVVHLGGNPVNMDAIVALGKIAVEDCAQAMGAKWQGRYVGTWGNYAVYSMLKNVYQSAGLALGVELGEDMATIGRGVQVYKCIKTWLEERASYRTSVVNMLYKSLLTLRDQEGGFKNVVRGIANSAPMEEALQYIAALNIKRKANYERIVEALDKNEYAPQQILDGGESSYNRILVRALHRSAQEVISNLRQHGIAANNLTQSYIHPWQEPIWNNEQLKVYYDATQLSVYNRVVEQIVAIPNSPFLTEGEINHICEMLKTI